MQTVWNATFCYTMNMGSFIEKKNTPHVQFVWVNWLFILRQKGLFHHLYDSSDPKGLDTSKVEVVWPVEFYQVKVPTKKLRVTEKLGVNIKSCPFQRWHVLFLLPVSQFIWLLGAVEGPLWSREHQSRTLCKI